MTMDGTILSVKPTPNPSIAELVDAIAVQDALAKEHDDNAKVLKAELLALVGDEKQDIDGVLFRAVVVAEGGQWKFKLSEVREEMGESWIIKRSKWSKRKAYILITGRKVR